MIQRIFETLHTGDGALSFLRHVATEIRDGKKYFHYTAGSAGHQTTRIRLTNLRKQILQWYDEAALHSTSESGGVFFYHGHGFDLAFRPNHVRPNPDASRHFSVIFPAPLMRENPFARLVVPSRPKISKRAQAEPFLARLPKKRGSKRKPYGPDSDD
ncbi:hypothetical protein HY994_02200 [Candidatus Micrarchaeota archaeon]|nr:hypothetical protein [Candidatus Micrarchaeota archaeon]